MMTNDKELNAAATESIREIQELEIQVLHAKIARLNSDALTEIREVVKQNYRSVVRLLCEITLDIGNHVESEERDEVNKKFDSVRNRYSDMADLILHGLNKAPEDNAWGEYIALTDWIKNNSNLCGYLFADDVTSISLDEIATSYFQDQEYDFGMCIHFAYEKIFHGAPIYRINEASGNHEMVPTSEKNYAFMNRLGGEWMDIRLGMFPSWLKGYFFKKSDLEAYDIFFRGELPDENGIEALRYAYRRYLSPSLIENELEEGGRRAVNSSAHDRLLKAIAEFPSEYPKYKARPPKLDAEVRPWMANNGFATSEAEQRVFGAILAEHFKLPAGTKT